MMYIAQQLSNNYNLLYNNMLKQTLVATYMAIITTEANNYVCQQFLFNTCTFNSKLYWSPT